MATNTDLLASGGYRIFAGEDRDLVYTVADSAGAAVDVTGWAISWVAGAVTKTVGAGVALTTPASGVVTVTLAAADTEALSGLLSHYRLRRTDTGANVVLAYGRIKVLSATQET